VRIAFYAPLKPADHPVASGDRRVAQLFLEALRAAGHTPVTVSRLRSHDGGGDPRRQARLAALAERQSERLLARWRRQPESAPGLWFTYHLYHKAPDWLGPRVADALGIPYVVAEASFAAKQAQGAWALGHRAVARALARADAVIGLNPADREGVLPLLADSARWVALRPFLDAAAYRPRPHNAVGPARLIAVAMMRPGDKLASYRVLGAALSRLLDLPWTLEVVGDGPAREAVAAALAPLGARVAWRGALAGADLGQRVAGADLCVWPAVNEAIGMALLEAQASGVPVVAGSAGGVPGIVTAGVTGLLAPAGDAAAFAAAVRTLLLDPARRAAFAEAARRQVLAEHDLPQAARRLAALIDSLAANAAASPEPKILEPS
jgi:glycosyltransferase involved in cell wall biosynthesis